ncbi:SUF system FeS assembly protein, NifU family [Rippkaea orientalis PCC 8801]|uniref:SUF system FeS assembly protein, NifU family n=1 Tax=Rippkaea orientalis (strain PCC 8801 / RF-1) TaxID=41431 RepID=B7K023_RIPO1|nr:SUF system NifU family Fe-S cluster assembly protein [Rippkaea orientalis]ACK66170.1 SUF system FeS assembly protein, NifU family [Rippkaea orientalis PCC 8801]
MNRQQQLILDHYKQPHHRGRTALVHRSHQGRTPYCGDIINLTIQLNASEEIIEDLQFEGNGCVICLASADLMAEAVRGKRVHEALQMVEQFRQMMQGQGKFPDYPQELAKLNSLQTITHPLRIKCANLAWYTLKAALSQPLADR